MVIYDESVIYDGAFDAISDSDLLNCEPEMNKKEMDVLDLVPKACGFSTGDNANLKCDVQYSTPPAAQRSQKVSVKNKYVANNSTVSRIVTVNACQPVKRVVNPYITSASYESPTKKPILNAIPTLIATKPVVFSTPTHCASTQSITSSEFSPISTKRSGILRNPFPPTTPFTPVISTQPPALRSEVFPHESYYLPFFHVRTHNTLILTYRCVDNTVALKDPTPTRVRFTNI